MKKREYCSLLGKNPNNLYQVKKCGNHIEISYIENNNNIQQIQKISDREYINLKDGTINKFNKNNNRSDNISSVKKSIKRLRDIINTNCTKPQNVLFVTLTYKQNMCDRKQLLKDFDSYNKRFKRYNIKKLGYAPKYICVPEPQQRGAWHCHILYIYNEKVYLPNEELNKIWGKGYVNVKRCDNVDNVGAYLSAYLSNLEGKKGGRLNLYPVGMHLFRHSCDILEPIIYYDNINNITEMLQDYKLTYWCSYETENENYGNRVEKRFYTKHE